MRSDCNTIRCGAAADIVTKPFSLLRDENIALKFSISHCRWLQFVHVAEGRQCQDGGSVSRAKASGEARQARKLFHPSSQPGLPIDRRWM